jgi:predicted TIM-barrel fold metal-dependent hydrolase
MNRLATISLWAAVTMVGGGGVGRAQPPEVDETDLGPAVYVGDTIIKGYDPTPALVTPVTLVPRPKYPATDIHAHWSMQLDPAVLLASMDDLGVERAINLSGGFGPQLDRMLERFHRAAPGRLLIFANIDFTRIDEPNFGAGMAAALEAAAAKGVAGVKIFKSLGLTIKDDSGKVVAVDDPRLDPIWAACGRLGIPVLIHSADPIAFFEPIDEQNERWVQLHRHPDWSFHGPQFPSFAEVLAQHDRMIARHPGTTFISAHMGSQAEDLTALAERLARLPNLHVDISGRVAELGRQPYAARRFLLQWQDRVLYGTDRYPGRPDQPRHRIYCRFLETADEYFKYYDHPFPPTGEWRIYGVHLPDEVLRKIYQTNADRVLGRRVADLR